MRILKISDFGKFNFSSTRLQNSSLAQENVPQNVGALLVCRLHNMGVNISRSAYLGVSQPLGNAHTVHAVEVEHGCHCVPECVGIDVGQAVALAELFEIASWIPSILAASSSAMRRSSRSSETLLLSSVVPMFIPPCWTAKCRGALSPLYSGLAHPVPLLPCLLCICLDLASLLMVLLYNTY